MRWKSSDRGATRNHQSPTVSFWSCPSRIIRVLSIFAHTELAMAVTLPKSTSRPREITVAAIVAFIGSVAFAMAGLVIAGTVGVTILVFKRNYPGVSVYRSTPDFLQALRITCLAVAIP